MVTKLLGDSLMQSIENEGERKSREQETDNQELGDSETVACKKF